MNTIDLIRKKEWCIEQHRRVNQYYSEYLPYEFHLRMVYQAAKDFSHLVDNKDYLKDPKNDGNENFISFKDACEIACFGHDLLEDVHSISYNDVTKELGQAAADIIYAVTNEKGKNRKERANLKYYEGIRNTPGAVFVKLCDRIANAQYGKLTKSSQFEMYKKENQGFIISLGKLKGEAHEYDEMFNYLNDLFESK